MMSKWWVTNLVLVGLLMGYGYFRTFGKAEASEGGRETNGDGTAPLQESMLIRAFKQERELEVWVQKPGDAQYQLAHTYPIAACNSSLGPKLREGDGLTPEGFYGITAKAMNPKSKYHLSMNIGYPNAYDRALGRTGSWIMIHGSNVSIGCLAMTDPVIESLYHSVEAAHHAGQKEVPVHVFPFRMSEEAMAMHKDSEWLPFWQNLKEGYDAFETTRMLPRVSIRDKRYAIEPSKAPAKLDDAGGGTSAENELGGSTQKAGSGHE